MSSGKKSRKGARSRHLLGQCVDGKIPPKAERKVVKFGDVRFAVVYLSHKGRAKRRDKGKK